MKSTNFPELILRTFEHRTIDRIVWQPRIMYWYNSFRIQRLTPEKYPHVKEYVPKEYIGKDIKKIYQDLNASIRYPQETFGYPLFYE